MTKRNKAVWGGGGGGLIEGGFIFMYYIQVQVSDNNEISTDVLVEGDLIWGMSMGEYINEQNTGVIVIVIVIVIVT